MLKFFKYKWAVDGETTAVPNAVDPAGYVSYRQGYGADYSRVYGTDPLAKAPERVKLNAVLQDITAEIQSLQVHGFPDYITSALNGGTAYAYDIGAVVRWTDNKNYRNTVSGNTNDPSVSGWVLYNDPADSINSATAKTTPVDADLVGIADSAASFALKKVTWANVKATILSAFGAMINTATAKTTPVDADIFIIGDSAASNASKKVTFANIKSVLTTLFAPINSPAFTGAPTAPTAAVGTNTTQVATTAFAMGAGVGSNQTWTDVTASRALETTYTNTTGKPILVYVSRLNTVNAAWRFMINGTVMGYVNGYGSNNGGSFIVPNGATYSVLDTNTLLQWTELR